MHFNLGVLYIRNVRNLGPRGLKVGVGDALLRVFTIWMVGLDLEP